MEYTVNDAWDLVIPIFLVVLILFFLCVFIVEVWLPFWEQRKYLKAEVHRSGGEERRYWKRELRYFYLRNIPLLGILFRRKHR